MRFGSPGGNTPAEVLRAALRQFYDRIGSPTHATLSRYYDLTVAKQTFSDQGLTRNPPKAGVPRWDTLWAIVQSWQRYAKRKGITLADEWWDESWWRDAWDAAEAHKSRIDAESDSPPRVLRVDPRYVIEEFRPHPISNRESLPPSQLLSARNRIVKFTGRGQDLEKLTSWRDASAAAATLLMHGEAGQGKTRLAEKFAEESREAGWLVAVARHRGDVHDLDLRAEPGEPAPDILIMVDYADRWPVSDLLAFFGDPLLRRRFGRVRVLMLSRSHEWLSSVLHDLADKAVAVDVRPLDALTAPGEQRRRVFDAARDRFAEELGVADVSGVDPSVDLDKPEFGVALNVHMAALVAVDAMADAEGRRPPADPNHLSAYLLYRERAHWQKLFDPGPGTVGRRTMARAVFIATLVGGVGYTQGQALLDEFGVTSPSVQDVLDEHAACYPSPDSATVLVQLYPDRLGEDFLALQIPGHNVRDYPADPWAAGVAVGLLASGEAAGSPWVRHGLTILIEAARRWEHVRIRELYPMLRQHATLALSAGSPALTGLTELPDVDVGVLEAIELHLPWHRHVDLDSGIAATTEFLTAHRLRATRDDLERAELYRTLVRRLCNAGRYGEALAPAEQTVATVRQWGRTHRVADEPEILATSLLDLGMVRSNLGQREDALEATQEAVATYRRLEERNPGQFQPGLAAALTTVSVLLSMLGRMDEAEAASRDAVDMHRRLAATRPAEFEPAPAAALNNRGSILWRHGHTEEALTVAEEAVALFRRLTAENTPAFEPDLAAAVDNLAGVLMTLGRARQALAAGMEAVEIYRRLVRRSAAHDANAVLALSNLGGILSNNERHADALAVTTEAVELCRPLAAANPAAFELDLARALRGFAWVRTVSGLELAEADAAAQQLVQIYQRRADGFRTELADAHMVAEDVRARLVTG